MKSDELEDGKYYWIEYLGSILIGEWNSEYPYYFQVCGSDEGVKLSECTPLKRVEDYEG